VLLCLALFLLVDSFLVPHSRDLDPGRSGERVLFLLIVLRAVSKSAVPTFVVVIGTCLAVLVSCMNHDVLNSRSLVWTVVLLLAIVMLWVRGDRAQTN
jgi:hypothetical protein